MNKLPLISIIMLNYNGLQYIQRTIPALKKLTYPNYEIIIVDNGSTDGSLEYLDKIKDITFLNSPRIGEKNFACNLAAEKAAGEYILMLDNDFLISDKDILSRLINEAESLSSFGTLSLAFIDENEKKTKGYGCYSCYYYSWAKKNIDRDILYQMNGIEIGSPNGAGFLIKKSIWDGAGGYDSHLPFGGDDDDLGIRLWIYGYKNYLFSRSIQTHIGIPERTDTKNYSTKFGKKIYAHLYTVIKNFNLSNMIFTIIGYSGFFFLKSLKQSATRFSFLPLIYFFKGYYTFLKNLKIALTKRKIVQAKRVVNDDVFLKIRPQYPA